MAPASSKIKHPAICLAPDFSLDDAVSAIDVLNSILAVLGRTADLVDSCHENSRVEIDKEQRRHFCETLVNGANGFTSRFNAAATITAGSFELYTVPASYALNRCRSQMIIDLENPLKDSIRGKKSHHWSSLDLKAYQATLESLLDKIGLAMQPWLDEQCTLWAVPEISAPPIYIQQEQEAAHQNDSSQPKRKHQIPKTNSKSRDCKGNLCVVM